MKRIKKGLLSLTLGLVLSLGVGASIGVSKDVVNVKADTKTINYTLNNTVSGLETKGEDLTTTTDGVTLTFSSIGEVGLSYVQLKKSSTLTSSEIKGDIEKLSFIDCAHTGKDFTGGFKVECSSDSKNWTEIYSKTAMAPNAGTIEIENIANGYSYFRLTVGSDRVLRISGLEITYEGKTLGGIDIDDSSAAATTYKEDDVFDPTGLKIYVLYSDMSEEVVTYSDENKDLFTFNPSLDTRLKPTDAEIEITYSTAFYGSETCSLPITVNEDKVVSISISESSFEGKVFILNEDWSNDGIVVKATKESGNVITLLNDDEDLTLAFDPVKPNSLLLSEVNVTATYTGITASVSKTLTGFNVVEKVQSTYDFAGNFATYAEGWGSGYGSRTLTNKDLGSSIGTNINFKQVSRQTGASSITDRPVFKGSADSVLIDFNLTEAGYTIADVAITFAQWSDNELTLKLYEGAYSASSTAVSSLALKENNLVLSGKISGTRFQVTTSASKQVGLTSIVITAIKSGTSVKEAEAWGKAFMTATNSICVNDDNSTALLDNWNSYKEAYEKLTDEAKTLVKAEKGDSSTSATMLKQAVARYDHIITRYGSKLGVNANFIGREIKSTSGTHNILASADNGLTIAIIVIVSLVSVSSIIGATIVIRKRKTN